MICGNCKSAHSTVAEVKACYAGQTSSVAVLTQPAPTHTPHIEDGYYTIVFDENTDDRITLRVRPHWEEDRAARGEKVVDFLRGPENTRDYTGFAFLTSGTWRVWKRYAASADGSRLERALQVLHRDPDTAGLEYAMRSGNCWCCGRTLTVPASIHRGLGPVCAKRRL